MKLFQSTAGRWRPKQPVIDGRLSTEPPPVIERYTPRRRKDPLTVTELMLIVAVVGLFVAIAVSTGWQHLWSTVP